MGLTDKLFRGRSSSDREAAAHLAVAMWQALADGFREDELQHEGADFARASAALQPEIAALAGAAPDAALLRRMLEVLQPAVAERIAQLHARVDDLAETCRSRDRELQTLGLASSWQVDELERCRDMLIQALQGRETVMPGPGPEGAAPLVSQLLSLVLHIQVPPPRPQASLGRRATEAARDPASSPRKATATEGPAPKGDHAVIAQALREVLDGSAPAPKLARAIEDQELARRVADLAAEHRTYRAILQRIGVLPRTADPAG